MASRRRNSEAYDPFTDDQPSRDVHETDVMLFGTMDPTVPIKDLRLDGGTQPRASLNGEVVEEYAEAMQRGDRFPPVVVFYDGENYWLVDGFHRVEASKQIGVEKIRAEIKEGSRRDAVLFSLGVNAQHGLQRTNQDKRRAVITMLADDVWGGWAIREIARHCHVSPDTVSRYKQQMIADGSLSESDSESTYITKHGTISTMNTAGIAEASRQRAQNNEPESEPERPAPLPTRPPAREAAARHADAPDLPLSGNGYQIDDPEMDDLLVDEPYSDKPQNADIDDSPTPPVHQPLREYQVLIEQLNLIAEATGAVIKIQPAMLTGRLTADERRHLCDLITDIIDWFDGYESGGQRYTGMLDHIAHISQVLKDEDS